MILVPCCFEKMMVTNIPISNTLVPGKRGECCLLSFEMPRLRHATKECRQRCVIRRGLRMCILPMVKEEPNVLFPCQKYLLSLRSVLWVRRHQMPYVCVILFGFPCWIAALGWSKRKFSRSIGMGLYRSRFHCRADMPSMMMVKLVSFRSEGRSLLFTPCPSR